MNKKLYRSEKDKMLAGVCAGIAEYLEVDTTLVRLIWAGATLFAGASFWLYILAAIIIPKRNDDNIVDGEYRE